MKNKITGITGRVIIVTGALLLGVPALGEQVICDAERITGIQLTGKSLYWYNEERVRRKVAPNNELGVITLVNDAIANNAFMQAAFPEGHDCDDPLSETMALWVYRSAQTATSLQPGSQPYNIQPAPSREWFAGYMPAQVEHVTHSGHVRSLERYEF